MDTISARTDTISRIYELQQLDPATDRASGALGSAAFNTVALNASGERWVRWPDGTEVEMQSFGTRVLARLEQFLAAHAIAT